MMAILYIFLLIMLLLMKDSNCEDDDFKTLLMPDEGNPHAATWLAYGATTEAWGTGPSNKANRLIARKDIIRIAVNLCRFEPVKILINEYDLNEAKQFLNELENEKTDVNLQGVLLSDIKEECNIEFIKQPVNDLWMRDVGPVFVNDQNRMTYGVNFNFNGWGQKDTNAAGWKKDEMKAINGIHDQRIEEDQQVADFIIQRTGVTKVSTWLVMEGGGVEVNGKGTAICTESCILNDNRNPGRSKEEVENELQRILGIKKVIWLPGIKGNDITDGHIDFYARFVDDRKVVFTLDKDPSSMDYIVTHQNQQILSDVTDAFGNKIIAIPLVTPNSKMVKAAIECRNKKIYKKFFFNERAFASSYVGFYLTNKLVLMAKFGDEKADKVAFNTLKNIYPSRKILQITTDGIANGGGTIHCATQQQI